MAHEAMKHADYRAMSNVMMHRNKKSLGFLDEMHKSNQCYERTESQMKLLKKEIF